MGGLERDAHGVGFAHMRCVVGVHAREQSPPCAVECDVGAVAEALDGGHGGGDRVVGVRAHEPHAVGAHDTIW